ncbi:YdcF family protein [Pedobacter sp. BS3]|uniref:YdcF family protein n=1 Tax=Pedobacter sp. BS3 TaxID=2567937 RepID=UPI0011EF3B04|nr:YdcF family protein [Pedobacter sp. BS3]TZF84722.1 YdcF family protein [Pedobacter sp. BS3]
MFALGKLFLIFLNPVLWIVAVLLYGLFTKPARRKKNCYTAGILMLLFFSNPFIIDRLTVAYQEKKYTPAKNEVYSAGILLGGFSGFNEGDGEVYFNAAADRFIQAAELYRTGHIRKIIVASGNGNVFLDKAFREADFVTEQLQNLCIPAADILADRDSRNTVENAVNTKKLIDSLHLQPPYLLITSALHIPRALRTFRKAGLDVKPFPAAFTAKPSNSFFPDDVLIPSADALAAWKGYLREVCGNILYRILGRG